MTVAVIIAVSIIIVAFIIWSLPDTDKLPVATEDDYIKQQFSEYREHFKTRTGQAIGCYGVDRTSPEQAERNSQ